MGETKREQALRKTWPVVTHEDIEKINDLFPHYLFFRQNRKEQSVGLWSSCCGHHEVRPYLLRTETPKDRELMDKLHHREGYICPWCGKRVTVIDLSKAGQRKNLFQTDSCLLLHATEDALYADALWCHKDYETEDGLTAKPEAWCCSGYRFARGEVMQIDHQAFFDSEKGSISWERESLGRQKLVAEPFKVGYIGFFRHENYCILNRDALTSHPFFRWCGYFDRWQYRPGGGRGYTHYFSDLISYLTVYSIYPRQVEMMSKFGLWGPLHDMVYTRKQNAGAMDWNEADPRKSFGLNKTELAWFLENRPSLEVLEVRKYIKKHWDKMWRINQCEAFCETMCEVTGMKVLRFLKKWKLDPDRFMRYLSSIDDGGGMVIPYSTRFEIYRDYLESAYNLGQCVEHGKVLWPDNLLEAHDKVIQALECRRPKDWKAGLPANVKNRKEKYEFEMDGLKIIFPMTSAAIKREGAQLDHCVGGYAQRHMDGILTILFLRRSIAPSMPYVTIEMQGNRIQQIHGYKNDVKSPVGPRELHEEFLNTWLKWLASGSKRDKDGKPVLPKKKRSKGAAEYAEAV